MEHLSLLGLNHTTAPLEVREQLVFDSAQMHDALARFHADFPDGELVLLSTCNRLELYSVRPGNGGGKTGEISSLEAWPARLTHWLAGVRSVPPALFAQRLYHKTSAQAVEHLFNVAASLDSMVLGEAQILGQVRAAYDASREVKSAGRLLHPLFQRAVAVGKDVQTRTSLGDGRLSVASVAVDFARRIFDHFADKTVLCIGAGKMSSLVLRHFANLGPGKLIVCNRDLAKAENLSRQFNGSAADLQNLPELLASADIVVSGTGSARPIITRTMFDAVMKKRRYRPVFVIDIALPRDVEASVGEADNVYLYNLDDLQETVAKTLSQRKQAVDSAGKIVNEHLRQFLLAARAREIGPAIDQLYKRYHAVGQEELARTLSKFNGITAEQKAEVEELVRRLVNKILHDPVRTLRQNEALHGLTGQYLHAMEMLFNLEGVGEEKAEDVPPEADQSKFSG